LCFVGLKKYGLVTSFLTI